MTRTSTAEAVLIAHQRHAGGCLCGWSELGKSLPGHQVKMLAEAGVLVPEESSPPSPSVRHAVRPRADDGKVY